MNLIELANKENELYSVVTSINVSTTEKELHLEQLGVFKEYFKIHQEYTLLHKNELEALKRGLFLSWYSKVEPAYLTGIRELDPIAEQEILTTLDTRVKQNNTDYELDWMLSYYATWDVASIQFNEYKNLGKRLKAKSVQMPKYIDTISMGKRGQMGVYWSFMNFFE